MSFLDTLKEFVSTPSRGSNEEFARNLRRIILIGEGISADSFLRKHPKPTMEDLLEFREGYDTTACVLLARNGFFNLASVLPDEVWERPEELKQITDQLKKDHLDETEKTLDLLYYAQEARKTFDRQYQEQKNIWETIPGVQITLMRHGHYNEQNNRLDETGAEEITDNALLLKAASYPLGVGVEPLAEGPFPAGIVPDLIVTSQNQRAIDSGFALQEQLKAMGIAVGLQTGVAYFNEVEKYHHDNISSSAMPGLVNSEQTQKAIEFLKKCAQNGARHIVVVCHKPNVHILGSALTDNMRLDPPSATGDMISVAVGNAADIGRSSGNYAQVSTLGSWDDYKKVDRFIHRRWMKDLWHPLPTHTALSRALKAANNGGRLPSSNGMGY